MVKAMRLLADDKEWRKELRKTYRTVAKVGARAARAEMRAGDRQLAAVAGRIRATANTGAARLSVPLGRTAAAVYGTNRPTGWLGNKRHEGTTARNNPAHIGNAWTVATRGEGPRGINDGLADARDEITDAFEDAAGDLIARAVTTRARNQ